MCSVALTKYQAERVCGPVGLESSWLNRTQQISWLGGVFKALGVLMGVMGLGNCHGDAI